MEARELQRVNSIDCDIKNARLYTCMLYYVWLYAYIHACIYACVCMCLALNVRKEYMYTPRKVCMGGCMSSIIS